MNPTLNIAVKAARAAGRIVMRASEQLDRIQIEEKGHQDFVTNIDKQAEQEIINIIHSAYPTHSFLGEENGAIGDHNHQWIIDPIDGTANFIRGLPHFSISIALTIDGRIEHGVIYDPVRDELFTASRGQGAKMNDRRLRVSPLIKLNQATLATGIPFKRPKKLPQYSQCLSHLLPQITDIRRGGSAALDLAYVAAGRVDGYWEIGLGPWDIAAGLLLVQEAGGLYSDFSGGNQCFDRGEVIAANPKLFKQLLQQVGPAFQDPAR